jgi:ubiquinone biosynthesis protein COQ9
MSDALTERTALKDKILEQAFRHAAFEGWSNRMLAAAAADAGVDRATAQRLFPRDGESLVAWIDDWADRRMLARAELGRPARQGVRGRVSALVRARFEALGPHREGLRRATLARALPHNLPVTLGNLWRTVDRIWEAAGFPATQERGLGRYTRRLTLASVLVSTTLYWLEDRSDGSKDSWGFLERRIDDVMRLGSLSAEIRRMAGHLPGFRSGR